MARKKRAVAPKSPNEPPPRSLAIVSGKGGSGKTMVTAAIAKVLDLTERPLVIVDADTGTAGITYYLGLKYAVNTSTGVADVLVGPTTKQKVFGKEESDAPAVAGGIHLQLLKHFNHTRFLGMGNQRMLFASKRRMRQAEVHFAEKIRGMIHALVQQGNSVIVDCRGGIDLESLAVCEAVDDIVIIVETDTTSFQATQNLVHALWIEGIAGKMRGFIINKVMDDPTHVMRNGAASFKCQCLGAVPFDIKATRAFLVGEIPSETSSFGIQVWDAVRNLYGDTVMEPPFVPWRADDFRYIGVVDVDSLRGGIAVVALSVVIALFGVVGYYMPEWTPHWMPWVIGVQSLLATCAASL